MQDSHDFVRSETFEVNLRYISTSLDEIKKELKNIQDVTYKTLEIEEA